MVERLSWDRICMVSGFGGAAATFNFAVGVFSFSLFPFLFVGFFFWTFFFLSFLRVLRALSTEKAWSYVRAHTVTELQKEKASTLYNRKKSTRATIRHV